MDYAFADKMLKALKRLLLVVAGGLGGLVVGGILSLVLFHLRRTYSVEISSLGIKVLLTLLVSSVAGLIAPRFFMMYFLCPFTSLMDTSNTGRTGLEVEYSFRMFLLNGSYLLGLILFLFGVYLSMPWLVGAGLAGIGIFSIGTFLGALRSKGGKAPFPLPFRHGNG